MLRRRCLVPDLKLGFCAADQRRIHPQVPLAMAAVVHVHLHYHYLPPPPSVASLTRPLHLAMALPTPRAPACPPPRPLPACTCPLAVTSTDEREANEEFVVATYKLVPVDDPRAQLHFSLGPFSFSSVRKITWMLFRLLQH
ncbi:hypothetical protein ACQJBY_058995 [Aegilops geniculata]